MSLWTIVPIKPLNRAKSRLADVLSQEQRSIFAEQMFRKMMHVLSQVPHVTGTLVISRDMRALAIARDYGARTIQETSPSDLNPALNRATEIVRLWGANAVLILPADLPFITPNDIVQLAHLGAHEPSIVATTDRIGDGTNALLIRPIGLINYSYGVGSFNRHQQAAKRIGANVHIYESPTIQLDIDVPQDLDQYNRLVSQNGDEILTTFLPDVAT